MDGLLERMRRNPVGDWTIRDVETLCRQDGIFCEPPRGGGSHCKIAHPKMVEKLTIPYKTANQANIHPQTDCLRPCGEGAAMNNLRYAVLIEPLPADEGGGFIAVVPDLPGCMSDGETPEEALVNVRDAIETWIEAAQDMGHEIPASTRHAVLDAAQ